jgi:non-homologous end joining protein Ku
MDQNLPSTTVIFTQEETAFARFRRALRKTDQVALDDLLVPSRQHLAVAKSTSHALPFEVFLLALLVEEHKEVVK